MGRAWELTIFFSLLTTITIHSDKEEGRRQKAEGSPDENTSTAAPTQSLSTIN